MTRRLRVLILSGFPAIGGPLPKLAPLVAEGLRDCGFEVALAGWSAHSAGHESLPTKAIDRSGDLRRVLRRVREWRPDVLYVATAHNRAGLMRDIPLAFAIHKDRPPLVVHFHGSESDRLGGGWSPFVAASGILVDRAAAVLLLSEEERAEWLRFRPEGRFEVVVNPFVPPPGASSPASRGDRDVPVLLCVARLIRSKGVFDLIDAFAMLSRRLPCRLRIAGIGPERVALQQRIDLLGLQNEVELLGYVAGADLDRTYRDADVFVLPSYFAEGFPLSVMEAMSFGLPVVTTPIRGCADHLADGENAVFVPARAPQVLARSLEALLADSARRRRMGAANRLKVEDFAPDRVIPAYAAVLEDVVAARTTGGVSGGRSS